MVATGFSGRLQKFSHGRGNQVHIVTVRAALRGFNANLALDTGRQTLHQPGSNNKYILPLQYIIKEFKNIDPPQIKNLVVHTNFMDWLYKWVHSK